MAQTLWPWDVPTLATSTVLVQARRSLDPSRGTQPPPFHDTASGAPWGKRVSSVKAAQEQHLHGALPRPQPPVQQTRLAEASDELFHPCEVRLEPRE